VKARSNRSVGKPTTPAVVSNATPSGDAPAPGGVLPTDTPTTPAVPSTEPLPSDQATPAKVPTGEADAIAIDAALTGERPAVVPETPTVDALTAPVVPADEVRTTGVIRERVGSDVPLPADQASPYLPRAVPSSMREMLAQLSDDDRAALRDVLLMPLTATTEVLATSNAVAADEAFAGSRLFPVDYDVEHDGTSYAPGDAIELTFAEHQHFQRASAVTTPWLRGEVIGE
jgi:hypothetical protein